MEQKKWYQSKTIWGIVIAAFGMLLTEVFKVPEITLPANADFDQLQAYAKAIQDAEGNLGAIFGQILAALGSILAIIGRVKAETKIV